MADVSHELRTPLTTIRGNIDLLRRGAAKDPQARQETLEAIEGEATRMSRMVADLLLLAQADAGIELEKKPVELDTRRTCPTSLSASTEPTRPGGGGALAWAFPSPHGSLRPTVVI